MLPWSILAEHAIALALLWASVLLAGFALLPVLRLRIGIAGIPLLGIVYWTIALYVLPFAGGLDLAAGLATVLALAALIHGWRVGLWSPIRRHLSWATLLLALGSLAYTSTLIVHYVPFGMDASMHATNAVLIARSGGLPTDYAPFMPDIPFPAVNLGLPAVASLAIRWGGDPSAVILATHHLTFTTLILSTYLLLRWWTRPTTAALLAVVSVWMARSSQGTLAWGGFPTVMSVAIGVFAARLLLQQCRTVNWRSALAAGAAIASLPLIHGVGGGTWIYCAGGWISLATLSLARNRRLTLRGLAFTGVVAAALLGVYRLSGKLELQPHERDRIPMFVQLNAPPESNWPVWLTSIRYVSQNSENLLVWPGWLACVVLALRRQWTAFLLLTAAWLTLITVVANSRWLVLPGSFLLYPERVLYWAAPLCAVGAALVIGRAVWHNAAVKRGLVAGALGILLLAGYYQNKLYQKLVREDFVNQDGWEALIWAKEHLRPESDFVETEYNSLGAFLPAFAQVACTGAHHHLFYTKQRNEAHARRPVTHVFVDQRKPPRRTVTGEVVFRNPTITVVKN